MNVAGLGTSRWHPHWPCDLCEQTLEVHTVDDATNVVRRLCRECFRRIAKEAGIYESVGIWEEPDSQGGSSALKPPGPSRGGPGNQQGEPARESVLAGFDSKKGR